MIKSCYILGGEFNLVSRSYLRIFLAVFGAGKGRFPTMHLLFLQLKVLRMLSNPFTLPPLTVVLPFDLPSRNYGRLLVINQY